MVKGRRIAFIGWTQDQGAAYIDALNEAGATCEHLEYTATQALASVDVVFLRIAGTIVPPAAERSLLESCPRSLVAVGDAIALQPLLPLLRVPRRGFALASCSVRELELRASVLMPVAGEVQPAPRHTVVVADDDRITRALIEAWLVKAGFTCHSAGNGEEALDLTKRLQPSAVILDVYMPRRNGLTVLREIRQEPSIASTRVVMLSGSAEQDNVLRASALHADAYMVKPLQGAKLVERLKKLLDPAA